MRHVTFNVPSGRAIMKPRRRAVTDRATLSCAHRRAPQVDAMPTLKTFNRTVAWVTIYGVAMGVLEAALVIYLRRLYFPGGFHFPLWVAETEVAIIELWRETATILMLIAVGALAGRNRGERFAYFLYAFGIWDLVYYVFLKLAIDWPSSLLTWDILFLLPVPWFGPILTPG